MELCALVAVSVAVVVIARETSSELARRAAVDRIAGIPTVVFAPGFGIGRNLVAGWRNS